MQISKQKLQEALEVVKPGLANKDIIEQSTAFAFTKGRVVTYNDEISISYPLDLQLEGAIQAGNLYQFLTKVKKEEIEIDVRGSEILLQAGRIKAGLTLEAEIKLPLDEEVSQKGKWKDIPEGFLKALSFSMSSCGKDMSKPVLTCVHVNQTGILEASDDYRVTRCTLKEELPIKTFLLPATSAVDVLRMKPGKIAEGKGWIHFQTSEGAVISCRTLQDEFPNVSPLLKVKGSSVSLPGTMDEVLERAQIFAKREHLLDEQVEITIGSRRLKIRSESPGSWFEEEVNLKYDGEPVTFFITPYLLKDILKETLTCVLSPDKLKFEGDGWVYITALRNK